VTGPQESGSHLYRRLTTLRRVLPLAAGLAVLGYETLKILWLEGAWQPTPAHLRALFLELLFYGVIGPAVGWLTLTWIIRRVEERDEAEAHLRSLYQVSRQAVATTEEAALVELALRMPGDVLAPVRASLIVREHPDGPWILAGARGFQPEQREALEAYLVSTGAHARCDPSHILAATQHLDCPMLSALPEDFRSAVASVICLPLSTERPPHAVLSAYLPAAVDLSSAECQALESMAAGLGVALDHARLRARELHMLRRMERAVRQREDLVGALEYMLADVVGAHQAEVGAVFLVSPGKETAVDAVASWPGEGAPPNLAQLAQRALREAQLVMVGRPREDGHGVAVPLAVEGETVGALTLAGQRPFSEPQMALLSAAAGLMALLVRNSQLYQRLESQAVLEERGRLAREVHDGLAQGLGFLNLKVQQVDRLLNRQEWETARQALGELRAGVQDLYAEVRLTIQDLRWRPDAVQGLVERLQEYVADFATRSGLDVSLTVAGEPRLPPRDEVRLLRIAQEALVNVHRHARARHVWVRLREETEGIVLEVEDDGIGFPLEHGESTEGLAGPGHFGLRHIRERVDGMAGRLDLHSVPDQGTVLKVTLPGCAARAPGGSGRRDD
jgi:signal transduction histidine kinase